MKKAIVFTAFTVLMLGFLALTGTEQAMATFSADIDCSFVSSGRGVCEAFPQGPGYSYSWYANGASVANRNFYFTSAACGGPFATIYVTVTDNNGNSSSASTSGSC